MPKSRFRDRCALTLIVLLSSLLAGCEVKKVTSLKLSSRPGLLANELLVTNDTSDSFDTIDLKITVWGESEVVKLERHWAYWKPGEEKVVTYTLAGGPLQRTEISGFAREQGRLVKFAGTWLLDQDKK